MMGDKLQVVFMGGKQAGCIGLLTLLASGHTVKGVIAYDEMLKTLAAELGLPVYATIKKTEVEKLLEDADILVSVHGREIIPEKLFKLPRIGAINTHPCLYRYKGSNPVERLLRDGETNASVGVHRMTAKVDEGEVLVEEFTDVSGKKTVDEVYNALYPFYSLALLKALKIINH